MKKILPILLFPLIMLSCDNIEGPYIEEGVYLSTGRKILLEDYTGHKCGNCPQAHEELEKLIEHYGNDIVPISIHVGNFARPDAEYPADYRTPDGNALNQEYQVSAAGLPNGIINRTNYSGNLIIGYNEWRKAAEEWLSKDPELALYINNAYDTTSRSVHSTIEAHFKKNITEPMNMVVYLIEDSIVSKQKDYSLDPDHIDNYAHRHMFRKAINGIFGEDFANSANENQILSKEFDFAIDSNFVETKCHVVAFVSKKQNNQVLQAEQKRIIE